MDKNCSSVIDSSMNIHSAQIGVDGILKLFYFILYWEQHCILVIFVKLGWTHTVVFTFQIIISQNWVLNNIF